MKNKFVLSNKDLINTLVYYNKMYGGWGDDVILTQSFSSVLFSHFKQIRGGEICQATNENESQSS